MLWFALLSFTIIWQIKLLLDCKLPKAATFPAVFETLKTLRPLEGAVTDEQWKATGIKVGTYDKKGDYG